MAGSLIFCGGVDAKQIQYSVCSLQRLASLLLLLIAQLVQVWEMEETK